ncbi:uncharacterized protein LOC110444323 [Mizuhopecten yessoensis]|uniref:uncharacterized protein LOC110444323 n=1 Tax=Mizuhopecten yessoensis TaxID=6573 RepID=UPI000B458C58|nr:uncharacterized protein LOC110444323 [Mizuhopecten yessoensis]
MAAVIRRSFQHLDGGTFKLLDGGTFKYLDGGTFQHLDEEPFKPLYKTLTTYSYTPNGDDVITILKQSTTAPYIEDGTLMQLPFCSPKTLNRWDFNCKVKCSDPITATLETDLRSKFRIVCDAQVESDGSTDVSDANASVPIFNFTDICLRATLEQFCLDDQPVPNIVHYIFFGIHQLSFFHFLSIWSAHIIQQPCAILIHGDTPISGPLWRRLGTAVPNLIRVRKAPPSDVFGIPIDLIEHKADVARLEAVRDFGGIYMDTDEILLRNLNPLRKYDFTLSHAFDYNLSNGLIMSARNASFVNIWYSQYSTYDPTLWGHHSTIVPYQLSQQYPHLIHVENNSFVNPDYDHVDMIFNGNFNWNNNYAIHLFIRKYDLEHNFTDVRHLNTTIGAVSRHVLFSCKELCSD